MRLPALAALAIVIAACTTSVPVETNPPADGTPTLPAIEPVAPLEAALQCGRGSPVFSQNALRAAPPIEPAGFDDASAALARHLAANPDPARMPRGGWRRVAFTRDDVVFVTNAAPGADSAYIVVSFTRRGGTWDLAQDGACHARVVFPEGVDAAEWWLDPDAAPPGPDGRNVSALVQEIACASGRPPTGRVLPPVVVYGLDAVVVTFATRPLPGGQDCPGAPPAPYAFELAEPLGRRALLDGGVFPPADARRPRDER